MINPSISHPKPGGPLVLYGHLWWWDHDEVQIALLVNPQFRPFFSIAVFDTSPFLRPSRSHPPMKSWYLCVYIYICILCILCVYIYIYIYIMYIYTYIMYIYTYISLCLKPPMVSYHHGNTSLFKDNLRSSWVKHGYPIISVWRMKWGPFSLGIFHEKMLGIIHGAHGNQLFSHEILHFWWTSYVDHHTNYW